MSSASGQCSLTYHNDDIMYLGSQSVAVLDDFSTSSSFHLGHGLMWERGLGSRKKLSARSYYLFMLFMKKFGE